MNADLLRVIDAFAGLHVLVIGEAMLDSYLEGTTERMCPEAPVPIVSVAARRDVPGGAGNTAVNVRSLGGRVTFLSVVGRDAAGVALGRALEDRGISTEYLLHHGRRRTLVKNRVLAASQLLLRFDQGTTDPLDRKSERALMSTLGARMPDCDAVIVSDYGYGILTPRVIEVMQQLQDQSPPTLVVDSKRQMTAFQRILPTAVKPNYSEVARLLGLQATECTRTRAEQVAAHAERILDLTGARIAAVTLDTDGAFIFERGAPP